jgi:hypothetical protein
MRFISEFGYTVRVGHEEAHQRWLTENEAALAAAAPAGSRYIGTFVVTYSTEKDSGGYRILMEMDSYGAQDAQAAAGKDPASEWGRLIREHSSFADWDPHAPWSNTLLKNVVDATIYDPNQ